MNLKTLILFILAPLYGCAATSPYIFDDNKQLHQCDFPVLYGITEDTERVFHSSIYSAFDHWNTIVKRAFVDFGVVPWKIDSPFTTGFIPVSILSRDDPWMSKSLESCGKARLRYDVKGCITSAKIAIVRECVKSLDKLDTLMRHEIGHVLGLRNMASNTPQVMNRGIGDSAQHPLDVSSEEARAVQHLYKEKLEGDD